jgi:hypothetical protein
LEIWLADKANHSRKLDAGTLHKTFKSVAVAHNIEWRFENGKALGQRLSQLQFALRERFEVDISFDAHAKQNRYAFAPKQPQPENPSLIRPAEPEEVPELAGFAGIERG